MVSFAELSFPRPRAPIATAGSPDKVSASVFFELFSTTPGAVDLYPFPPHLFSKAKVFLLPREC